MNSAVHLSVVLSQRDGNSNWMDWINLESNFILKKLSYWGDIFGQFCPFNF